MTSDLFQEECVRTTVVRLKLPCVWGKATKKFFSLRVRRCADVVLRGRRGTL